MLITNIKNELMDVCGKWLLQSDLINTLCGIKSRASKPSRPSASERRGDTLKRFHDLSLKNMARIWPWLTYICFARQRHRPNRLEKLQCVECSFWFCWVFQKKRSGVFFMKFARCWRMRSKGLWKSAKPAQTLWGPYLGIKSFMVTASWRWECM